MDNRTGLARTPRRHPPRTCDQCGGEFSPRSWRTRWCETCQPDRSDNILSKYNITREMFDAMYFDQDGTCAICHENEATCVDHDHACCPTSEKSCGRCIRGLLCNQCNWRLGRYEAMRPWIPLADRYLDECRVVQ